MNCTHLTHSPRRIAQLFTAVAAVAGLIGAAEPAAIRFSTPALGWMLSADGSQAIEMIGVTDSPRTGLAVRLPAPARQIWASPDGGMALLQLDRGLFLLRASTPLELVRELPAGAAVSAAWDRRSGGFVFCALEACESRTRENAVIEEWAVEAGTRVIAFSVEAGLVAGTAGKVLWRQQGETVSLPSIPDAAAFRPGTLELWVLDASGHLYGQDRQGRRTGEGELIPNGLGLAGSLDGKWFFAANAEGAAAVISLDTFTVEQFPVEDSVEGIWPGPGPFSVRLHQSVKRPVGFWSAESGAIGWAPAVIEEVQQ